MTLLFGLLALYCSIMDKIIFGTPHLAAFRLFTSKLISISRKSEEVSDLFWQLWHIVPYTCLPWNWKKKVHLCHMASRTKKPTWSATRDFRDEIGCFWNSASRWDMKSLENLRWRGKSEIRWETRQKSWHTPAHLAARPFWALSSLPVSWGWIHSARPLAEQRTSLEAGKWEIPVRLTIRPRSKEGKKKAKRTSNLLLECGGGWHW